MIEPRYSLWVLQGSVNQPIGSLCLPQQHFGQDQHLNSPHSNTAESLIRIVRLKGMITNLRGFD